MGEEGFEGEGKKGVVWETYQLGQGECANKDVLH